MWYFWGQHITLLLPRCLTKQPMDLPLTLIPPPKPQTKTSVDLMREYGIEEFEMEYTESDYDELINYKLFSQNIRPLVTERAPKLPSNKLVSLLAVLWKEFAANNPKKGQRKPSIPDFKPSEQTAEKEAGDEAGRFQERDARGGG